MAFKPVDDTGVLALGDKTDKTAMPKPKVSPNMATDVKDKMTLAGAMDPQPKAPPSPPKPQAVYPSEISTTPSSLSAPIPKVNTPPPTPQPPATNTTNSSGAALAQETPETKAIEKIASLMQSQVTKLDSLLSLSKTEATNVEKIAKSMA
jgi:hypothetical protein